MMMFNFWVVPCRYNTVTMRWCYYSRNRVNVFRSLWTNTYVYVCTKMSSDIPEIIFRMYTYEQCLVVCCLWAQINQKPHPNLKIHTLYNAGKHESVAHANVSDRLPKEDDDALLVRQQLRRCTALHCVLCGRCGAARMLDELYRRVHDRCQLQRFGRCLDINLILEWRSLSLGIDATLPNDCDDIYWDDAVYTQMQCSFL